MLQFSIERPCALAWLFLALSTSLRRLPAALDGAGCRVKRIRLHIQATGFFFLKRLKLKAYTSLFGCLELPLKLPLLASTSQLHRKKKKENDSHVTETLPDLDSSGVGSPDSHCSHQGMVILLQRCKRRKIHAS